MNLEKIGQNAKTAEPILRNLATSKKNEVLAACADALIQDADAILEANELDMQRGRENNMPLPLQDRRRPDEYPPPGPPYWWKR